MTLTNRLAVVTTVAAIPLVLVLAWAGQTLQRRSTETALADFIAGQMEGDARARCEADPARFHRPPGPPRGSDGPGGPPAGSPFRRPSPSSRRPDGEPGDWRPFPRRGGRPATFAPRLEVFVYDVDFQPADPRAPYLPADLRSAIEQVPAGAAGPFVSREGPGAQVALRTAWADGPCAIVFARLDPPPASSLGQIATIASLAFGFIVAVLVAAGPAVRRIRRLTADVRATATAHYVTPVPVSGTDEIAELASAFNDAGRRMREHVDTIEAREQTLRTFVANTTHDVMTPLTVLQGHLSAMQRSLATTGVTPAQVIASLEEAHYLGSLIHNLGAAAKLEAVSGPLQTAPIDLNALVERTVARHRPIAKARDIAVDYAVPETPVRIDGDVTLVEQAVSNVVGNAVRYNNPAGHVAIVLEAPATARTFSLRVADDGPGVPAAELGRLTDRHFRGPDARTRRPDGLGLGLHIASDVAERHGFELQFARAEGGGLEVTLRGPRLG